MSKNNYRKLEKKIANIFYNVYKKIKIQKTRNEL